MSRELEQAILGAVLDAEGPVLNSNPGALIDQTGMRPEDFGDPRVRVAWGILQRLAQRRRPADAVSVFAAGRTTKAFGEDDLGWLQGLQGSNALDRERFADLVDSMRAQARGRILQGALERGLSALREQGADLPRIAGDLEAALRDLVSLTSDDGSGDQDVLEISDDWDRQEAGQAGPVLIPSGIPKLDEVIGGLVPNLNMIVGLPSVGKSALLGTMIDAQLDAGFKVGLFGLEDGTRWLAKRIIAREMAMPVRAIGTATRTPEQQARFGDVAPVAHKKLAQLVTYRHDTITVDELCRRAANWVVNKGVQVIYVDHGGEVDHHTDRFDEHRLRVAESYRRLRNLALRYQVPVVVLAHTGRPGDDNEERPPRVTEIAESSYIERRARLILGVWRKLQEPGVMRATVLKQTEGESNVTLKLERHTSAALIDRLSGETVNLASERLAELKAQKESRERIKNEAKEKADAERASKAAAKARKAPQLSMVREDE
ncbi:MAG: DnaB-like helicase C-terminal domain-containing protein [Phycisphaerales bacterium]|nr:hypothetical protein [Chloroflexota bacterium]